MHKLIPAFPEGRQELGTDPPPGSEMAQRARIVLCARPACHLRHAPVGCGGDTYHTRARSSHTTRWLRCRGVLRTGISNPCKAAVSLGLLPNSCAVGLLPLGALWTLGAGGPLQAAQQHMGCSLAPRSTYSKDCCQGPLGVVAGETYDQRGSFTEHVAYSKTCCLVRLV